MFISQNWKETFDVITCLSLEVKFKLEYQLKYTNNCSRKVALQIDAAY